MITFNSKFLFSLLVHGCILSSLIPFTTFAQNKIKEDGKVHIKIEIDENGKQTKIDTVFESKDSKAVEEYLKQHNLDADIKSDKNHTVVIINDDKNSEKIEKELELAERKIKVINMENDSINKMIYRIEMIAPDEKEMEELNREIKTMKIEINDSEELPHLTEIKDIKVDLKGLSDADKKKFEKHMQKANEEIKKAMELIKDGKK